MKHTKNVAPLEYMAQQLGYSLVSTGAEHAEMAESMSERRASRQTM